MGNRLLFVHAHPDDESLWTGATIAAHTDQGGQADLVVCTWAEGTKRHSEVVAAAAALGMPRPPLMLGFQDDRIPHSAPESPRLCQGRFDDQVRLLVEIIRDLRPDAVITYDPIGIYGHPDHIHTHRITWAAVRAASVGNLYRRLGDPWQVRTVFEVTAAQSMVEILWENVFTDGTVAMLEGTPDRSVSLRVDTPPGPVLERKVAAIRAHHTEVERNRLIKALMALPEDVRTTLMQSECYLRHDLVPGGCDLLTD